MESFLKIDLDDAEILTDSAFEQAEKLSCNISVCVVDCGGQLLCCKRGINAAIGTIDAAILKAKSAIAFGNSTISFELKVGSGRVAYLGLPGMVTMGGGMPIKISASAMHAGAIGVSGASSTVDHEIAQYAIAALLQKVRLPAAQFNHDRHEFDISSVHHVAIICSNYEQSKNFYSKTLGFKIKSEEYRNSRNSWKLNLLVHGNVEIELFSFPEVPNRLTRPEAAGLRHLAFATKDVGRVHEYLTKNGIECEALRIDQLTGKQFFFFSDPDQLPLEVYER
jgi:glyoxylase I family protein